MQEFSRRELLQKLAAGTIVGGGVMAGMGTRSSDAGAVQPIEAAGTSAALRGSRPNIIFILADDLGYGDLGCYGQDVIQTPRIDRMAAEGIRFSQCYAGSTVCAPSRCVLMTGLHSGHCHVRGNSSRTAGGRVPLRPEDTTVAEILQQAGYATGLVGKWGLGEEGTTGLPNRKGFDYFYGYLNQGRAHTYYPEWIWRNDEQAPLRNVETEYNVASERVDYVHDLFTREALDYVERHRAEPFFLYLAYTIPHANNERGRALGDGMEVPDYGIYADRNWEDPQKGHAAMITRMDRDVGALLDKLRDLGIAENTLVIFSSDNGPHREGGADPDFFNSSGPLRGIKRDLYEGGVRVPGIAWWPGKLEAGVTSSAIWSFSDFLPTAADLAGASAPDGLDGVSLLDALARPKADHAALAERNLYWELHERVFKQAVRRGPWKAVREDIDEPLELYNLAEDIAETRNVAGDFPELAAAFEECLRTCRSESEHWPVDWQS